MGFHDFVSVIREISFDELESEARTEPRLLVIAAKHDDSRNLSERLFGINTNEFVEARAYDDVGIDPFSYDTIVALTPVPRAIGREWRKALHRVNEPLRLVECAWAADMSDGQLENVRRRIADCADDRVTAIGRFLPEMRSACCHQLISETSRVNGEFALVSNLPSLLPVIGTAITVGADFFVLTKNQLMLIFKLAAVYGKNLDNRWRIYSEMLPVVGAGLMWRTVAREVVTLIPLALGTVPKVAIAYAGTWVIGQSADVYYERGEKLNKEQVRAIYAQALETLRNTPITPKRMKALPAEAPYAVDDDEESRTEFRQAG